MANMNVRPYYEDFDDSKNFYRILFRPSFSLQARELTQSQTLIYDQLDKVNTLSDGDKISSGEITYDNGTVYLNSGTYYVNGVAVTVDASTLANVTNGKVGFKVLEQFISPEEDQTLYDNAYGTPNFLAPGAHRYKIELELFSRDLDYQSTDDFIEIFRVVNSKVQKLSVDVKTEAFLVNDFDINLSQSTGGYEIKLSNGQISVDDNIIDVSDQTIQLLKPEDKIAVSDVTTNANDGVYVIASKQGKNLFDIHWNTRASILRVNLHDDITSAAPGGLKIGTAAIKNVAYHDSDSIKVYLSEINLDEGKSIADISSLYTFDTADELITTISSGDSVGNPVYIFPFSETNIAPGDGNGQDIFLRRRITETKDFTSGAVSHIEIGADTTIAFDSDTSLSESDKEQIIIYGPEGETGVIYTKDNLVMNRFGNIIKVNREPTENGSIPNFAAGKYKILYDSPVISVPIVDRTSYTRTTLSTPEKHAVDNSIYIESSKSYLLNHGFIIPSTVSVTESPYGTDIDITDRFIIDDGQRDDIITNGSITLKDGMPDITSKITVSYDYWALSTDGNYATVDSYSPVGSYEDIPVYNGIKLSDSLDLRRHIDNKKITWSTSGQMVITKSNVYGNRTDKIIVDSDGVCDVIKGIPYNDQKLVPADSGNLTLYEVDLVGNSANLNDISLSKSVTQDLSKRDLNSLEKRVSELELTSKFSPLETEALTQKVPLEYGGVNAVLVDPFLGHNIGDIENADYMSAIDYETNELRPSYNSRYTGMTASGIKAAKNITLDVLGEVSDISNLKGTDTIIVNEFSDNYNGMLKLTPNRSLVKSTSREQILFDDSNYFSSIAKLSDENKTTNTIWKDWELFWMGSDIKSNPIIELINKEDKKIGLNYKPQFAGNTIDASVTGLAPTTEHDVYLDGDKVVNSQKTTDSLGSYTFAGIGIVIPSEGLSGKVLVEVKSDDGLSKASAYYHNQGIGNFSDYGELNGSVSQEFEVFEDTFFSKVDLYFSTKDNVLPVQVQIRKMDKGIPSKNVIISKSVTSSNVKIIGSTTVQFSPVDNATNELQCLKRGKYCITVIGSPNYSLYGDNGGVSDLNVGRFYRGISVLSNFKLKFDLYRVRFVSSSKNCTVKTNTISSPVEKIYSNPNIYESDSVQNKQLIVYQENHGYTSADNSVTIDPGEGLPIEELTLDTTYDIAVYTGTDDEHIPIGTLVFNGEYADKDDSSGSTAWGYMMDEVDKDWNTANPIRIAVIIGSFIGSESSKVTDASFATAKDFFGDYNPLDQFYGANFFQLQTGSDNKTTGVTSASTHIAGIDTAKFSGAGNVVSANESSYVWEKLGLQTKVSGFTEPSNMKIDEFKIKVDGIYINANQNVPGKTEANWSIGESGEEVPIQINQTNTFSQAASSDYSFNVSLKTESSNDRFSPIIYTDYLTAVLISNNINDTKISSVDPINLHELGSHIGSGDTGTGEENTNTILEKGIIKVEDIISDPVLPEDPTWVQIGSMINKHQRWLALEKGDILYLSSAAITGFVKVLGHIYHDQSHNISEEYHPPYITVSGGITPEEFVYDTRLHISVEPLDSETLPTEGIGDKEVVTTISKYIGQITESSLSGSSSMSKYISKRISVPVQSSGVCVEFMGDVSAGNEIEVYYNIDDVEYKKLSNYSFGDVETYGIYPTGGTSGYEKIIYSGGTGKLFNFLQVKIVFKGSNSTNVPKLKDLKIFAFATS